jgi:hypothetical protein
LGRRRASELDAARRRWLRLAASDPTDGDIGHFDGMLVDDETWTFHRLIVDTINWWLGYRLPIAPQWIETVNWFDSKVSVKMNRRAIKDAPAYDPVAQFERFEEEALYEHYGRSGYWTDDPMLEAEMARV